jgi:phosphate transport system permease protein
MRNLIKYVVPLVSGVCAVVVLSLLFMVLSSILWRGVPAVSWGFLTEQILLVGAAGGIFYNLIGTVILIITAALVCTPVAVGIALVHSVYLRPGTARNCVGLVLYSLNGVPSILFGILGLIVFVKGLGWGKSWLSGSILLGFMILPTVTVALMDRIKIIPFKYTEAARGLGLNRSQTIRSVILPQSVSGLITGLLLGLARAAGETAPIMFTATIFAGATVPSGIIESPVLSLPYHIFVLAQDSFDPAVSAKVWGTATVLLILVLSLSAVSLPMRWRLHEQATHG